MTAAEKDRRRWLAALAFGVATASLALQYALLLRTTAAEIGAGWATLRFFSYFTILSNLLVACAAASASRAGGTVAAFFRKPETRGAVALYIGVTGLVYFAILRHLWQPQGAQWWADTGLHYASPALYLAWWLFGAKHDGLRWRSVAAWLAFPAAYLAYALLRGAWLDEYPYPFIDLGQLGWAATLRNAAGVLALFVSAGVALVALDRRLSRS